MGLSRKNEVDRVLLRRQLQQKKHMKTQLSFCAACGLCSESCFLYRRHRLPDYTPSFKAITTLGRLYKKRGRVSLQRLKEMGLLLWNNCAMCRRCECPFGIDVSSMLAWARTICRSQGVYPDQINGSKK